MIKAKPKFFNVKDSIIITGEQRSGSTWLMELLSNIPGSIVNWEPLQPKFGVVPPEFKWGDRPFIPENDTNPEYLYLMENILTLKVWNRWTVKKINPENIESANRVITKFVRANLLLPWLTNSFKFNHKPIFLMRHPIAVAISQLDTLKAENFTLTKIDIPDWINNERFFNHLEYINNLESKLERKVALWCLNSIDTINHQIRNKWVVVYYENLIQNPQKELERILKDIHIDIDKSLIQNIDFSKASSSDFNKTFLKESESQLTKWTKVVAEKDLIKIQSIFDYFQLSDYSAFSINPLKIK